MSLVVDEHRQYLSDSVRVDAFARAIAAAVRPGDVVIDLGTGTGILGFFACRAGAARVYAIEHGGMIDVARALARANGVADRIVFVPAHSSEARLPEQADVLVGDLIGRMGFEAGAFEAYEDMRRWLKPGARVVPESIAISAAPVEHDASHRDVEFWDAPVAGFRTDPALAWSRNTGYPRTLEPDDLLAGPICSVFRPGHEGPSLRVRGTATIGRRGRVHGIGAWFSACLWAGDSAAVLTNAPGAPARIARRNVFLPLHPVCEVAAGDRVDIDVRIRPRDIVVSWSAGVHTRTGVTTMRHSTLGGMLLTGDDLRRQDPEARPRLTERGRARRTVLELCDGRRPIADIEREVRRRHPDLFTDAGRAQGFVAEVIAGYGTLE